VVDGPKLKYTNNKGTLMVDGHPGTLMVDEYTFKIPGTLMVDGHPVVAGVISRRNSQIAAARRTIQQVQFAPEWAC
jgi:hypothetical protein